MNPIAMKTKNGVTYQLTRLSSGKRYAVLAGYSDCMAKSCQRCDKALASPPSHIRYTRYRCGTVSGLHRCVEILTPSFRSFISAGLPVDFESRHDLCEVLLLLSQIAYSDFFSLRFYLGTKQQNSFILKHFRSRVRSNFALEDDVGGWGRGCRRRCRDSAALFIFSNN